MLGVVSHHVEYMFRAVWCFDKGFPSNVASTVVAVSLHQQLTRCCAWLPMDEAKHWGISKESVRWWDWV